MRMRQMLHFLCLRIKIIALFQYHSICYRNKLNKQNEAKPINRFKSVCEWCVGWCSMILNVQSCLITTLISFRPWMLNLYFPIPFNYFKKAKSFFFRVRVSYIHQHMFVFVEYNLSGEEKKTTFHCRWK